MRLGKEDLGEHLPREMSIFPDPIVLDRYWSGNFIGIDGLRIELNCYGAMHKRRRAADLPRGRILKTASAFRRTKK